MALVTKAINYIKSQGLNHPQFRSLLEKIGADYGDLVYYCGVHRLSQGKVLKRCWELIEGVIEFLSSDTNKDTEVATMTDPSWQR